MDEGSPDEEVPYLSEGPAAAPASTFDPETPCACDVTDVCDEGCTCDIACSAVIGAPPVGASYEMLGRAETLLLTSSRADGPIDQVRLADDAWRASDPEDAAYAPSSDFAHLGDGFLTASAVRPRTAAADVDDDGIEDALIADAAGLSVMSLEGGELARWLAFSDPTTTARRLVATGDLDGDNVDEAVLGSFEGGMLTLTVLDLDGETAQVAAEHVAGPFHDASLATGDVDGDGVVEIVVAQFGLDDRNYAHYGIEYYALTEGALEAEVRSHIPISCGVDIFGTVGGGQFSTVDVTTHDFDRDRRDEVVLGYRCLDKVVVAKLNIGDEGAFGFERESLSGGTDFTLANRLRAADVSPEVAVTRDVATGAHYIHLGFNRLGTDPLALVSRFAVSSADGSVIPSDTYVGIDQGFFTSIDAGDVDFDGTQEVVASFAAINEFCFAATCPFAGANVGVSRAVRISTERGADVFGINLPILSGRVISQRAMQAATPLPNGIDGWSGMPVVLLADLDGDSARIRATGDVYRHTTIPHVNAVLAAPPTWNGRDDIVQDGDSATSFGTSDSAGEANGTEIGASVGVTMGVEAGFFDIVEVRASTSLSYEYNSSTTTETTTTWGSETATGAESNMVVYRVTPWTSHVYEMVSHPNPEKVGTLMTINVPNAQVEVSQSLVRFRAAYGEVADELVPPALFNHAIGNPHSYMRPGSCTAPELADRVGATGVALSPFRSAELVDVGNTPSGNNTRSVSVAEQITDESSHTLGVEISAGGTVAGVTADVTAGFSHAWTNATIIGSEVEYGGSVSHMAGDIDPSDRYSWGLCVYNYVGNDMQAAYPVIDYVVTRPDGS